MFANMVEVDRLKKDNSRLLGQYDILEEFMSWIINDAESDCGRYDGVCVCAGCHARNALKEARNYSVQGL